MTRCRVEAAPTIDAPPLPTRPHSKPILFALCLTIKLVTKQNPRTHKWTQGERELIQSRKTDTLVTLSLTQKISWIQNPKKRNRSCWWRWSKNLLLVIKMTQTSFPLSVSVPVANTKSVKSILLLLNDSFLILLLARLSWSSSSLGFLTVFNVNHCLRPNAGEAEQLIYCCRRRHRHADRDACLI